MFALVSAFEQCNCADGWAGSECNIANCTLRNDCNGNGFCPVPNVCSCDTGYNGQDCGECLADYRDIDGICVKCPECYNGGTCDNEAKCECPDNFAGSKCQLCSEGYFGTACLPLPYITKTIPSDAIDIGDVDVEITGYNFGNISISSIQCLFGFIIGSVPAEWVSENKLKCVTPAVTLSGSGLLTTYLRVIIDSQYSYNSVPFSFYGLCPENQCEQGFCTFGECMCYYGYRGESCDEIMEPPILVEPSAVFELTELQPFTYQVELQQGSEPVKYSLLGLPIEGMAVNTSSGMLTWSAPVAKTSDYQVRVQATNEMTRDIISLQLHVSPSYYVQVTTLTTESICPAPAITFDLVTRDTFSNEAVGNKLAVLWVYEEGQSSSLRRKITVKSNLLGFFRTSYQPYTRDFGTFLFGGEHPTYNNLTVQGDLSIRGMDINRRYVNINGHPNETVTIDDAFTFYFKGGHYSGINVTFDEVKGLEVISSLNATTANPVNNTVSMSLQVTSQDAIKGRIYFSISTTEGVVVSSSYIYLDVRVRSPKLTVSPYSLDIKIANGASPQNYDVSLQNIGSRASSAVEVIMPPQQDVIVTPTTEYISSLAVDEVADVSFKVIIPGEVAVATNYYGTIGKEGVLLLRSQ